MIYISADTPGKLTRKKRLSKEDLDRLDSIDRMVLSYRSNIKVLLREKKILKQENKTWKISPAIIGEYVVCKRRGFLFIHWWRPVKEVVMYESSTRMHEVAITFPSYEEAKEAVLSGRLW